MQEISLTNGFSHLIEYLHSLPNSHLIIVSDSNLVFINTILKHCHLHHAFKDIFTNPAYFNKDDQCLIIEQYGQQTCPTCPSNMCKREIIEKLHPVVFVDDLRRHFKDIQGIQTKMIFIDHEYDDDPNEHNQIYYDMKYPSLLAFVQDFLKTEQHGQDIIWPERPSHLLPST